MTRYCCDSSKPLTNGRGPDREAAVGSERGAKDSPNRPRRWWWQAASAPFTGRVDSSHKDDTFLEDDEDSSKDDGDEQCRQQRGIRGAGIMSSDQSYETSDSDYQAVKWMRQRSAESSNTFRSDLGIHGLEQWTRKQRQQQPSMSSSAAAAGVSKRTAREESVEVDDLSLFGIGILDRLPATPSSSTTTPKSLSSLFDRDLSRSRPSDCDDKERPSNRREAAATGRVASPPVDSPPPRRNSHGPVNRSSPVHLSGAAEKELDEIMESLTDVRRRRGTGAGGSNDNPGAFPHREGAARADGVRGRGFHASAGGASTKTDNDDNAQLVARANTLEFLADWDLASPSSWSPKRKGGAPSSSESPPAAFASSAKAANGKAQSPRYVMQAVPRRSVSPRSSPRSSRKASSPRSSPRSNGSKSSPRGREKLEELRALDPMLPAEDSLSYVPSDVDSSTKQRYLRACRLLKSTLIEREASLLPRERAFLNRLLEDPGANGRSRPVDLDEQASAIETASHTLLSDPLFRVDSVGSSSFAEIEGFRRNGGVGTRETLGRPIRGNHDVAASAGSPPVRGQPVNTDQGANAIPLVMMDAPSSAVAVARFDGKDYPFYILGVTPDFKVGALTPALMESLRGFFPSSVSEENLFLKYSLQRDGPSLPTLLSRVRTSKHTVIAVETTDGYVFGAFCSAPWRTQSSWFGNENSFLWRLKRPRFHERSRARSFDHDSEIEVYPVFRNTRIQYCTSQTLAVGGGEWGKDSAGACPYADEPLGIGFMIDGDLMGGETNSCSTFCNPRLGRRIVSGEGNEFDIRCLEVWTVTPATSIEEAENLEMRRHFVDHEVAHDASEP